MEYNILKADIVNVPANEKLKEGSGTSRAIFSAAGRAMLTKACKEIGNCKTGTAVPTKAYKLNADYIIHAAVPRWKGGNNGEYGLLSSAYLSALNIAEILGCESIVFPLLAAGNNGFDRELAFRIAKESIKSFEGNNLKNVTLVVYGDTMELFVRMQGYDVEILPEVLDPVVFDPVKAAHIERRKALIEEGKDVAQKNLEDQIEKALVWLRDKKNVDMVINAGLKIFLEVIKRG